MSHLSSRFSSIAGCALGAWLLSSSAQISRAQDAIAAPAPFKVPALIGVPGGTGDDNYAMPAPMSVGASVTLAQLQSGALTTQSAWQSGQLTIAGIVRALNAPNLFESQKPDEVRLRGALVELLLEHGTEKWLPVEGKVPTSAGESLSNRALLGVADALSAQRDERAVSIYEAMLVEAERNRGNSRAVGALNHLASFYWDQGKLQQAADVFARGERYSSSPTWAAALRLDGARVYQQMGNGTKAKELYAQIPAYGDGWVSAISLYDQALALTRDGKTKAAYDVMNQPLQFTADATSGTVAQQAWLASYAYQLGDLDAALKHSQTALDAGGDGSMINNASVRNLYQLARDTNNRSGGWKNQPIQTDTKEVILQANPSQPEAPLYARFRIKTYGDTSVTASVDNLNIQARVLPVNNWQRAGLSAHEEEMEVIVQSNSLNKFKDVPLTLSSATRGKTTIVQLSLVEKSA